MAQALQKLFESSGFGSIFGGSHEYWGISFPFDIGTLIMYIIVGVLFYLAIVKKFEPLLLLPIAFGMLLANIPSITDLIYHSEIFAEGHIDWQWLGSGVLVKEGMETIHMSGLSSQEIAEYIAQGYSQSSAGLIDFLYLGVKCGIYPPLIFLGVGAMTDFKPLIANPKSLLLGASAQFGVFAAFFGALLLGFSVSEAASIGIIGGADGPTAIYVTKTLAPHLLGAIAVAAYSYMALVPFIQPPIMKLCTSKKERSIVMGQLRPVSKTEEILFPIIVAIIVGLILPSAATLVGCLMLGNLLRVSGVTERLSKTVQNELMNIVTIMLGISVGATATAQNFLQAETIKIIVLGLCAFAFATFGGILFGKIMCILTKGKVNPLIGSAGVSAVPMAARVSQTVGQKENPGNFLLMHAMGPNVAGVIGSAVAAGVFIALFQGMV